MSDKQPATDFESIVRSLRYVGHFDAADLIEQQAARIRAMERDVERYRSLLDATEVNADSFYWSRNEKAKSATIVAEMNAIFGMTEG